MCSDALGLDLDAYAGDTTTFDSGVTVLHSERAGSMEDYDVQTQGDVWSGPSSHLDLPEGPSVDDVAKITDQLGCSPDFAAKVYKRMNIAIVAEELCCRDLSSWLK